MADDQYLPRSERGVLRRSPERFGKSLQGRPLEVWPASEKPQILIVAGLHGEEPESTVVLSRALRSLALVPPRCAVVLCANPDGVALGTRGNARGVDINRNFPAVNWARGETRYRWTLGDPRDVVLSAGEAPASEPETRALMKLTESLKPKVIVTLHAPLACIDDPAQTDVGRWLSEKTGLPRVKDVGYPTPGSFGSLAADWRIPMVTYELPPESIEALSKTHVAIIAELLAKSD